MFEEVSNGNSHKLSFFNDDFSCENVGCEHAAPLILHICSNKDLYKVQMSASFAFQRAHFVTLQDLRPVSVLHYDLLQYTL